jgi:hypothetical protein
MEIVGKSLSSFLYQASRTLGKIASTITDIKVISTGNPEKIAKRFIRKKINRTSNKITRKIIRKIK